MYVNENIMLDFKKRMGNDQTRYKEPSRQTTPVYGLTIITTFLLKEVTCMAPNKARERRRKTIEKSNTRRKSQLLPSIQRN